VEAEGKDFIDKAPNSPVPEVETFPTVLFSDPTIQPIPLFMQAVSDATDSLAFVTS